MIPGRVDRDIEVALQKIEEQIAVIREAQDYRKRGVKAANTRRKRKAA
jgi:hypothetical protein